MEKEKEQQISKAEKARQRYLKEGTEESWEEYEILWFNPDNF